MSAPPASDREPLRSMWQHLTADQQPAIQAADFLGRVHDMLVPQTNGGAQLPRLKPLKVLPPASGAANTGAAGSAAWLGSPCTPELEQVLQQHHLSAEFERQARAMKEAASAAVAAKASNQKLDAEVPNVDGMDASRGTQTGSSPGSSRKRGSQNLQAAVPAAANAGPDEQTAGSISAPKRSRSSTPAQPPLRAAAPTPCPLKTCLLPRPASQPQLVQQGRPLTPHLGSLALESVPGPAAMACAGPPAAAAWTAPPPGAAVLSPTPTPDMDAFLQLMMQKRVLQQQLSHLQQQIAGTSQARTAMVYAARPPAAALTPAATEQAQQAQTCLDKTGNEQHHERAAALAASLLLAKQQQQKQHQLLQRALVEQLQQQQQQQRQDVRLYQPRPQLGASPVPPPPAPPPTAPPAMPAWQQLKVECQQQLRQLAAEEQAEDEEEERGELRSSASSSSPVHQLSQRTVRAERALNAVASLVLCPLSRRVMTDPVVAADGHTYERRNIQACFQRSPLSPITGKAMASSDLKPNHSINMLLVLLINAGQLSSTSTEQGSGRR